MPVAHPIRTTRAPGAGPLATETEALPPLSFYETIEMATINGARALGLADVTGSLTPGKRADIILVRTDELNIAPLANIETTIVQSATPANVDTVMVGGRFLKRGGELVDADLAGARDRAEASLDHLLAATQIQPNWVQSARPEPVHGH